MTKAFVFGKFLPFHKGHEALIRFALEHCDFLTVLICSSDKESISGAVRRTWIEDTFAKETHMEVNVFDYLESELPNTSVSSRDVSKTWAGIFKCLFPDYSLLFTSEPYGEFVAEFMGLKHRAFDLSRKYYPVSATALRADLWANWDFLPDAVKPDFAWKVVLLGTECTGKTTLTKRLSEYFKCSMVLEAARDLIPNSNDFSMEDLELVATEHARRIMTALKGPSPLLVIDTDIHTTISYADFTFQKVLNVSDALYQLNSANLYLYLNNDVEFVQDGTRLSEIDRNRLDVSHRRVLNKRGIDLVEIHGSWDMRFEMAVKWINKLVRCSSPTLPTNISAT
jgi:HTH-type transcriptional regulator, transcriptional repressor of NAD biosynthesis genes